LDEIGSGFVFDGCLDEIGSGFVEREATPELLMKLGVQLHLTGL